MRFRKIFAIPSILVCLLAVSYFGLRIALSCHKVTKAVRARISQDLNCDVTLSRASLNPLGTLALQNLGLSYRKADGLHEVFKADSVEVAFDPASLLESRLHLTAIKLSGAALSFERDSEGWFTLGRIMRPVGKRPALSVVVEAKDSVLCCADANIPMEFLRAEVARTGERVDVAIKEGSLLGGGLEGNGYITLEEDPQIHGEFGFRGISLAQLFKEDTDGLFDVKGTASCDLAVHGNASSENLLTTSSRLVIKDFSFALTGSAKAEGPALRGATQQQKASSPIVTASKLDVRPSSIPVAGGPMVVSVTAEQPDVGLAELLAARDLPELIPAAQRLTVLMSKIDQFEVKVRGSGLTLRHPRLSARSEEFEAHVVKAGENVILRTFKAQLWGGSVVASASFSRTQAHWLCDGRVDAKALGIQHAVKAEEMGRGTRDEGRGTTEGGVFPRPASPVPRPPSPSLEGWLTADFVFRADSQAESTFSGNGNVEVRRARLWSFPSLACVAELLKLPAEATSIPQELRSAFAADRDKFTFSRIELLNDRLKLFGKGLVNYSGELELDLGLSAKQAKSGSGPLEGLKAIFGDGATTQRFRILVTGDIASPEAAMSQKER